VSADLELVVAATPDDSHPASTRTQQIKRQDVTIVALTLLMRAPSRV
jgi:hypothetical protein